MTRKGNTARTGYQPAHATQPTRATQPALATQPARVLTQPAGLRMGYVT